MEASECLKLIMATIQNIDSIKDLPLRAKKIKEFLLKILKQGNVFDKHFLFSYAIFIKISQKPDKDLLTLKAYLLEHYNNNFVQNDTIFLIDILLGNYETGLINYLKRLFVLDFNSGISQQYHVFIINFLKILNDKKFVFYIVKELLNADVLSKQTKYERRTIVNWIWQVIWGGRICLTSKEELQDIYPCLKDIYYYLINEKLIDEVMHFVMFIQNIMYESFVQSQDDYRLIQEEITQPAQKLYEEWINNNNLQPCKKEISAEGKINIAIVRPNIGFWSPFIVEYSLIKTLINDNNFRKKYNLYFYSMDFFELWSSGQDSRQCLDMLSQIGIIVKSPVKRFRRQGYYNNFFEKVLKFRETLIKDQIDILIYSDHLYPCGEFLFLARSAPKQIYWCHGNFQYNVKGIDKRIVHFNDIERLNSNPYKWEVFELEVDEQFLVQEREQKKKKAEEIKKRFPPGTIFLGSIGRLSKVNNWEYLSAVAEIMKNNPETVYLACGTGSEEEIKEKVEKLGIADRFYFEGFVDPHVYGYVIDIYLNTFPEPGGLSVLEFIKKAQHNENKFVVSLN